MYGEKLGEKSMIGILDPTCVNQASHQLEEGFRDVQGHDKEAAR
jgi:hypothetical protein